MWRWIQARNKWLPREIWCCRMYGWLQSAFALCQPQIAPSLRFLLFNLKRQTVTRENFLSHTHRCTVNAHQKAKLYTLRLRDVTSLCACWDTATWGYVTSLHCARAETPWREVTWRHFVVHVMRHRDVRLRNVTSLCTWWDTATWGYVTSLHCARDETPRRECSEDGNRKCLSRDDVRQ